MLEQRTGQFAGRRRRPCSCGRPVPTRPTRWPRRTARCAESAAPAPAGRSGRRRRAARRGCAWCASRTAWEARRAGSAPALVICWTSVIVRRNWPTPRCASVSHCSGTITSSAAVSPLRVSTPSDGGQSMITTSIVAADLRQRTLERVFAARPHQQHRLGAGQVDVGGHQRHPLRRRHQRRVRLDVAEQHLVDRHRELVGVLAERERQTALRIEVDEQHPSTLLHHRRAQRRDRRRLGYPTLLIGDRKYPRHGVHPSTRSDPEPHRRRH